MVYAKYHDPWLTTDALTTAAMDHIETQYDEAYTYFTAHNHDDRYYTKTVMESTFWYSGNDGPASGSDADLIYKSTGNLHAAAFIGMGVPVGLIIMWSGGAAPSGWHLCDGTAGTVDLRDMFILGAGTGGPGVGDNGSGIHAPAGTVAINGHILITAEIRDHRHEYSDYYMDMSGGHATESVGVHTHAFTASWSNSTGNSNIGSTPASAHSHSAGEGTAFAGNNFTSLPPYYALAFIQKTA